MYHSGCGEHRALGLDKRWENTSQRQTRMNPRYTPVFTAPDTDQSWRMGTCHLSQRQIKKTSYAGHRQSAPAAVAVASMLTLLYAQWLDVSLVEKGYMYGGTRRIMQVGDNHVNAVVSYYSLC